MKKILLIILFFGFANSVIANTKCPSALFDDNLKKIEGLDEYTDYSTARITFSNNGYCVGTAETYIVLYKESGYPFIANSIIGHHLTIELISKEDEQLYVMHYKAGGNQTLLEFVEFNPDTTSFKSIKKFASNMNKVEYKDGEVFVQNQTLDNDQRKVVTQKFMFDVENKSFTSID
jgi:hypothetical protein